ncbi:MAG: penicillin-binding protein activator [Pseudomonadota bacterium]
MPHIAASKPATLVLAILVLLAAGCDQSFVRGSGDSLSQRVERAQTLLDSGNARGAAQGFEQAANLTQAEARDDLLLRAASAWLSAGQPARALMAARRLEGPVPLDRGPGIGVLAARVAYENGDYGQSLDILDAMPASIPVDIAALAAETRGLSLFATGEAAAAITTLNARELWLENARDVLDNQRLIWNGMANLSRDNALPPPSSTADNVVSGWLELGAIAAEAGEDDFRLGSSLLRWEADNGSHPAAAGLVDEMLGEFRALTRLPGQIALVLPLSGPLQTPGSAIRDGFLSAYFEQRDAPIRPLIRVYDSAALGAAGAYAAAVKGGADFVAGPLAKSEVTEIVTSPGKRVQTLALNYLPNSVQAPGGFYQFALAPEHEAQAAALFALSNGLENAVALVPQSAMGERLIDAFRDALESNGGSLLDAAVYNPNETDFKDPIRRVLELDYSRSRHRQLVTSIGMQLEFEPRRRQDVDFVFLAATSQAGQLMRPQLKFHYAQDLPVYATASIFEPGASRTADLDGVMFADMPWIVAPDEAAAHLQWQLGRLWPNRFEQRSRLFAMGYDAYRLIPRLYGSGEPLTDEPLDGLTGQLVLDDEQRVVRYLEWARIRNGEVQHVLPPLDLPGEALPEGGVVALPDPG